MEKKDIYSAVTEQTGISATDAKAAVDVVFKTIADELILFGDVQIDGFGSFRVDEREVNPGRNPRTGEIVGPLHRHIPKFKAAFELRAALNLSAEYGDDSTTE